MIKEILLKDNISGNIVVPSSYLYRMKIQSKNVDGDLLNVFRIIGSDLQKRFEKNSNPRYNLFVSRLDGKANKEVAPSKDILVAFWGFNNL